MTLILTAVTPTCIIQAGDRLLTRRVNGKLEEFDEKSNKSVIYEASDGVLSIGYCGLALILGKLTDEWIAEQLNPAAKVSLDGSNLWSQTFTNASFSVALTCDGVIGLLRKKISELSASHFRDHGLEVVVSGWQIKNDKVIPILVRFARSSKDLNSASGFKKMAGSEINGRVEFAGSGNNPEVRSYMLKELMTIHEDRQTPKTKEDLRKYASDVRDALVATIKFASTIEKTVGANVHTTTMHIPFEGHNYIQTDFYSDNPHPATIEMSTGIKKVKDAAVTGWVLFDSIILAPSYLVGGERIGGKSVVLDMYGAPPQEGLTGFIRAIPRKRS